jgi:hypothetical protein
MTDDEYLRLSCYVSMKICGNHPCDGRCSAVSRRHAQMQPKDRDAHKRDPLSVGFCDICAYICVNLWETPLSHCFIYRFWVSTIV